MLTRWGTRQQEQNTKKYDKIESHDDYYQIDIIKQICQSLYCVLLLLIMMIFYYFAKKVFK